MHFSPSGDFHYRLKSPTCCRSWHDLSSGFCPLILRTTPRVSSLPACLWCFGDTSGSLCVLLSLARTLFTCIRFLLALQFFTCLLITSFEGQLSTGPPYHSITALLDIFTSRELNFCFFIAWKLLSVSHTAPTRMEVPPKPEESLSCLIHMYSLLHVSYLVNIKDSLNEWICFQLCWLSWLSSSSPRNLMCHPDGDLHFNRGYLRKADTNAGGQSPIGECLGLRRGHFSRGWRSYLNVFSSVTQLCPTLCNAKDCSTPGFPGHHQHLELAQTRVHQVGDTIQPSHPLSSPSLPAHLSQHQGLFQWISSLHQVAEVLEFQLQHQSFQWIFRTEFL